MSLTFMAAAQLIKSLLLVINIILLAFVLKNMMSKKAGMYGGPGGPDKMYAERSHIGGFFPSSPDGVSYSFPPDYDYMKKYAWIEPENLSQAAKDSALRPLFTRMNAPGLDGYPYGNDRSRIYNHMVNDHLMALQLGASQCDSKTWASDKTACPENLDQFNVEGFGNDRLVDAMSGL